MLPTQCNIGSKFTTSESSLSRSLALLLMLGWCSHTDCYFRLLSRVFSHSYFSVYRKWNERLFEEMYKAYAEGRAEKDPSEGWYHGEMGFFDFYIIPLAKKLQDCGVFGVSSDEYLQYALANRKEWEERGEAVVAEMLNKLNIQASPVGANDNIGEEKSTDNLV